MGTLVTRLVLLPPRDPESKGVVERRNGWFETSFMLARTFISPADFNTQLTDWIERMNARTVPTMKSAPAKRLEADRAAMLALPPIPLHRGWSNRARLPRDYYVRLDTNDYSVDPRCSGRLVDVSADLKRVRVRSNGRTVADHARIWSRGMTITDPAHVLTDKSLRTEFQHPHTVPATGGELERELADYDRALAPGRGDVLMASKTSEAVKQIHYLAAALNATRITEPAE